MIRAGLAALLARLPGHASARWPQGEPFVRAIAHGSMSVELYAPQGADLQQPHAQDELYIVERGSAVFRLGEERVDCGPGSVLFVPAGADHRFESFTPGFRTWVVFWGPEGGER